MPRKARTAGELRKALTSKGFVGKGAERRKDYRRFENPCGGVESGGRG